jgi:hypothetical protein
MTKAGSCARWNVGPGGTRADYIDLMTTLGILAFQTDTTRVVTMSFGTDAVNCGTAW